MNSNDGYDHSPDHDECDAPRGDDPKLRRENGVLFYRHYGIWWQCGPYMPAHIRREWLAEEFLRDRAEKGARV